MTKWQITAAILFTLVILGGSLSGNLDAMSWPSEDAVLIRNFGFNDMGRPVLGMVFNGGSGILAADKGEVIFSRGKNDTGSRLPSPLGAWTAVDHGDGLISIYSRYDGAPSDEVDSFPNIEKSQPIALPGSSGWSSRDGFYFIVFDRRDRRWINPAMIVTPVQETRPVQILSVELRNAQGLAVQSRALSQGRYTVIVNTQVRPAANAPYSSPASILAPQRIVCMVNGAEAGSLNFEAFYARDGVLMVYRNGLIPARQVYAAFPAFEAAEVTLTRGQANLEIIVQPITGNPSSVINRLVIN
ncbi:MAG: hypothetical protein LBU66_00690 [Treponema sp.]|jgi:murein DD-endopeptidase MepM/ murein hydrolase activator NlpD|nr:hypothetical protein [Treponema sp.]